MSWNISFFAAETPPPPVEKMPSNWEGGVLGTLEDIRRKISDFLQEVDWSDPYWGRYDGTRFSLEFNIGKDDPSFGFGVHVCGSGDAVSELARIEERHSWYILDTSLGEWLHHCSDSQAGWTGFQEYRDRVLSLDGSSR